MKYEELQYERLGDANKTYPASTLVIRKQFVDAAIAELKARIHDLESMPHTDNSAVIERLSNENECLVKCCKEYDSRHRIDETIIFNGARQLCATKRELLLSRAERYKMREFIAREEANLVNQMSWSRILRERTYDQWVRQLIRIANLANKLQNKCRAKAEEYK